jgi:hypothetical protein
MACPLVATNTTIKSSWLLFYVITVFLKHCLETADNCEWSVRGSVVNEVDGMLIRTKMSGNG